MTDAKVFGATDERTASCKWLDATQQVTLRVESGNFIRFQPNTGVQCNVLPMDIYKEATLDFNLRHMEDLNSTLVAFGGPRSKYEDT